MSEILDKVLYNGKLYIITMASEDNAFGLLGLQPVEGASGQIFVEPEEVQRVS